MQATRSFTVTVGNSGPTLDSIPDQTVQAGNALTFTAFGSDPDGDPITFSLVNPPAGATIDATGNFFWTPTQFQIGTFTITVRVTDPGGLTAIRSLTITVTAP